jgi:hypothetical protein
VSLRLAVFSLTYIAFYVVWELAVTGFIVELVYYFAYLFPAIMLLVVFILNHSKESGFFPAAFSVSLIMFAIAYSWQVADIQLWVYSLHNSVSALIAYLALSAAIMWLVVVSRARRWLQPLAAAAFAAILQVGVLANPNYPRLYSDYARANELPNYRIATAMLRIVRGYPEVGQWALTWASNAPGAEFYSGAAWANYFTGLLNVPTIDGGLPEVTSHELGQIADQRFGHILIVSADQDKIQTGIDALKANGVEVTEQSRVSLVDQPKRILGVVVAIRSRPPAK